MPFTLVPVMPGFVARIEGFDVTRATDDDVVRLKAATADYPVMVLPDQHTTEEQQIAFVSRFGPLDTNDIARTVYAPDVRTEIMEFTNLARANEVVGRAENRRLSDLINKLWHTDSSFKAVPAHLSMLYAISATNAGGETQFADLRAGYDALSLPWKQMIEEMVAEHNVVNSRVVLGFPDIPPAELTLSPVAYDIVRTLPETGRRTLYLSSHASHIIGLPVPVGRMILLELTELATTQNNIYTHSWRTNDFVIWNNRCLMHRLRRYNLSAERRRLRRVAVADTIFRSRDPSTVKPITETIALDAA